MHQIIFAATPEAVELLEPGESPANHFPCMSSQQFHRDARAQLYALVTGRFFDDAYELEARFRALTEDGPFIYRLDEGAQQRLAELGEEELGEFAELWRECDGLEHADLDDVLDFLYPFVHFCQTAHNDGQLGVFIYSDD